MGPFFFYAYLRRCYLPFLMLDKLTKLFLLLFLISFATEFRAQPYIGMMDSTSQWNFRTTPGPCLSCQVSTYFFNGDTSISSISYKKLYKSEVNYHNNLMGIVCDRDSICSIGVSFVAGLRDDILNKKVYIYDPQTQVDTLLYDFDLALGDTLAPTYYNRFYQGSNDFIVDSIGFDTIGSSIHRVFYIGIDSTFAIRRTHNLIEGIGGNWGLTYNSIYVNNDTLDCYVNSSGIYPKGISSCNFISSITEEEKLPAENWHIYPNPTDGEVRISSEGNFVEARIYALDGRLINAIALQAGKTDAIDIEGDSGVYLLQLQTEKGEFKTTKIVKQ